MIHTSENYSSEDLSDMISAIKKFHCSVESAMRKVDKGRKKKLKYSNGQVRKFTSTLRHQEYFCLFKKTSGRFLTPGIK